MAIKIANTTVIDDGRNLTSIANATSANTANSFVTRDASGNFSAGTITANLTGNATTAATATNQSGGSVNATTVSYSGEVTTTSTSALQVPVGTTAQRPTGANGKFRFNTTTSEYEAFNAVSGLWSSLGGNQQLNINLDDVLNGRQNVQVFNASGTFTVPAGVTKVYVFGSGGGGGGGGSNQTNNGGCGGGGGSFAIAATVTPGAAITCTVGAGGVAGTTTGNGGTGGTTSFGTFVTSTGGVGGTAAVGGGSNVTSNGGTTTLSSGVKLFGYHTGSGTAAQGVTAGISMFGQKLPFNQTAIQANNFFRGGFPSITYNNSEIQHNHVYNTLNRLQFIREQVQLGSQLCCCDNSRALSNGANGLYTGAGASGGSTALADGGGVATPATGGAGAPGQLIVVW